MRVESGIFGVILKLAPAAVLSVCLIITLLLWNIVRQDAEEARRLEFNAEVNMIHSRVDERLDDYSNILRGAAGLFAASESVSRREFRTYVNHLQLSQTFPGIQGVGFARVIPAAVRERAIRGIRSEGFPQFTIRPEGVRDPYTAIIYLEPFDWRNQRAFGYDMYAEPVRRAAMERARDAGSPALSARVVLVQETEKGVQNGVLMYLPVYRNGVPHDTLAERRRNLAGWVYEPFRMNDLMNQGVLGRYLETIRDELEIQIYDGDTRDREAYMYDSLASVPGSSTQPASPDFSSVRLMRHFGRDWTIVVRSLPAFDAKGGSGPALSVAIGGVIISLLLSLITWLMSTTNARAIKLAKKMSEQLEQTLTQTVSAMATVVEMRDPYTAGHQRRAAELARAIATEMGLDSDQILVLYRAALIYEVGKVQVPAEILSKPSSLDDMEYRLAQSHAQAGFDILNTIDFPGPIAEIVHQHHERMDGSGYPQGLKGDQILLEARILAVADVVEAMCSHRPYRPELGVEAALQEITSARGIRYDPQVVDACVMLFRQRAYHLPAIAGF
jgi:CHASE1-domain containing sensor protein